MVEIKTLGGGLNMDDSQYRLQPNDYIDALNITHDAVEGSNDQVITNIVANRIVSYDYHSGGIPTTIGTYPNTLRNTIIEFAYHPTGYHSVIEFNLTTRVRSKIFENLTDSDNVDILGFTQFDKITSINVFNRDEGDLLFFIDSLGRPTEMDITLFKSGEYTPVTRAIIDKGKKPPLSPPIAVYDNDTTRRSNNFRNKLFRFKYRWVYDDFEKSTFSPISIVPLPVSILSDVYTSVITNNNVIRMVMDSGDKNVKSVEVAMSYVEKTNEWSDFQSISLLVKSTLGLVESTNIVTGALTNDAAVMTFSGGVTTGAVINIYITELPNTETLVGTYTVVDGDTIPDITAGLVTSMQSIGIAQSATDNENVAFFVFDRTVYSFDRVDIILDDDEAFDNIDFPYSFYNDSTYPTIDLEESVQLFDYVPDKANCQELLNGNILAYAGITEGYDKDTVENATITVDTVPAGDGGGGSLYETPTPGLENGTQQGYYYAFVGIPSTGTVINIKVKRLSDNVIITASTYTTVSGDTATTVAQHLKTNLTAPNIVMVDNGLGTLLVEVFKSTYEPITGSLYSQVVIIPPASSGNSIATWKWSSERSIARAYFDEKGKTNGILYADKVTFPAYAENGTQQPLIPFINYKINDIPPAWAYSVVFYANKDNTHYIFWESVGVNKDEAEYIYFNISSFTTNATNKPTTATVLSYTFQDGDRVRVLREAPPSTVVFPDTYDAAVEGVVVDPVINFVPQTGTFLKIKNVEPFTSGLVPFTDYVMELYRPTQQSANAANQVYFEFGRQYFIIDPTLDTRRHSGEVTDQVVGVTPAEFNFYEGDAYFRPRTISTGGVGYQTFNVMDRNYVDFYISAVSSVDGRPNIIDLDARRAYYSTLIRHGEAYQANTNINGLNRFYAKNFDEYDYSFGDVRRIKVRDRQMRVFQMYKIGVVPLYSSIGKDANGLQVIFQTDKLLNPIQYYAGNHGIGDSNTALASFIFADYFIDNTTGDVCRVSNDGVLSLSELYKVNSWSKDNLPLRTGNLKTYLSFDPRLKNLVIACEAVECIVVNVPDYTLNNAPVNVFFTQSVELIGSLSFTVLPITVPAWMTVSVSGRTLTYSGTPTTIGTGVVVYINIVNDCGNVFILKTITIVA